ncbi:carbonic anhydrase [Bacillus sp. FJAT-47783]|uniref:beta-class carbonic anhydrase n=1 Tax=Bacillus sp. FJAT-47783 TaxID=2922712 RepID=UPI001FAB95B6|nr:carbonic anhydrase [Bacillus sp. FJAT-47783]
MSLLNDMLQFNEKFVENAEYQPYETSKFPNKRLVIFSCMDTRLVELLPKALNIKNGDVKMVKNAGAILTHPLDSTMRSILVAVYELQADEVMVIGHHRCGMAGVNPEALLEKCIERGIKQETISTLENSGIDLHKWLEGFDKVEENVKNSVNMIKEHPLMPKTVPVHGLVIDPETGKLDLVIDGYEGL